MKDLNNSKILIVKLDHIGDLILATPVFKAIKAKYPNCMLAALVNSTSAIVLKNNPYVNKIYHYNSNMFNRSGSNKYNITLENFETICEVKNEHFDVCIGMREDLNNISLQKALGADFNISYSTNTPYSKFLDYSIANDENKHAAEINFDLLKLINVPVPKQIEPEIFTSVDDDMWVENFLMENNVAKDDIVIAISIGGGWQLNWWPYENYAKLCENIYKYKNNVKIVLVGGKAELELSKKIQALANYDIISAVGKTTIHQLCALFKKAAFTLTNDGGPMHMSTAVKAPVIALFGPSPYMRFGPLGNDNIIITKKFECSPCPQFIKGQKPKCTDNKCMKAITVDEVFKAVCLKLKNLEN